MVKWSEEEIVDNIFKKFKNKKITLLAPLVRGRKDITVNYLKICEKKVI